MNLSELYELAKEYEKELILAEAKVKVINDLIARAEEKEKPIEEAQPEESESGFDQQTSIY